MVGASCSQAMSNLRFQRHHRHLVCAVAKDSLNGLCLKSVIHSRGGSMRADSVELVTVESSIANRSSHSCGGPYGIRMAVSNSISIGCGCITRNGAEYLCSASFSGGTRLKHQGSRAFTQHKARTCFGKR